jgi:xylulokinase
MWSSALDLLFAQTGGTALDLDRLTHLGLGASATAACISKTPRRAARTPASGARAASRRVVPLLSRPTAPIWMDSSTAPSAARSRRRWAARPCWPSTPGSRAFERFTGPQIRRFAKREPGGLRGHDRASTSRALSRSVLVGRATRRSIPGDGSGMNLMDLAGARLGGRRRSDADRRRTCARSFPSSPCRPDRRTAVAILASARSRLPTQGGGLWSGDNPCSLIGPRAGARRPAWACRSGTQRHIIGPMGRPRGDTWTATDTCSGAPTGEFMGMTVFSNGRWRASAVRDQFGLTWEGFSRAPRDDAARQRRRPDAARGSCPEITPEVAMPGVAPARLGEATAAPRARGRSKRR